MENLLIVFWIVVIIVINIIKIFNKDKNKKKSPPISFQQKSTQSFNKPSSYLTSETEDFSEQKFNQPDLSEDEMVWDLYENEENKQPTTIEEKIKTTPDPVKAKKDKIVTENRGSKTFRLNSGTQRAQLRQAVIWMEILKPPKALSDEY